MSRAIVNPPTDRSPAPLLAGRGAERERLQIELERARRGEPAVALVRGAAGMGKTALARELDTAAGPCTTLWLSGEPFEQELRLGVVDQLLRAAGGPLHDVLHGPDDAALPVEPSLRVLEALGELQAELPLLLVVDDVQWVDGPSLNALLFALRRLVAERVLAVFVCRDACGAHVPEGVRRLTERRRGPVLELGPLGAAELQELAGGLGIELGAGCAERLAGHTGGNPLLARAVLTETSPDRWPPPPAPLPVPRSYVEIVRRRLAGCPPAARELAFAAAVLGRPTRLAEMAALAGIAEPTPAFEALEAAELMHRRAADAGGEAVSFSHPLSAAAVYERIPATARAALHRAAAGAADDPAVALRHRVQATDRHDDELAAALVELADRDAARGAWGTAAESFAAAGRLSADAAAAASRLLHAIDLRLLAGDRVGARALAKPAPAGRERAARRGARPPRALRAAPRGGARAARARVGGGGPRGRRRDGGAGQPFDGPRADRRPPDGRRARLVGPHAGADRARRAGPRVRARHPRPGPRLSRRRRRGRRGARPVAHRALRGGGGAAADGPRLARARHGRPAGGTAPSCAETARAAVHTGSFNFACLAYAHLARAEYLAGAWDEALVHVERAAAIAADFKGLAAR